VLRPSIPASTIRSPAAPLATHSGTQPKMKAKEVIRIGRRRNWPALSTASFRVMPRSCPAVANSTIRIAFFAARPMIVTRPMLK